jgi:hypothetical protein
VFYKVFKGKYRQINKPLFRLVKLITKYKLTISLIIGGLIVSTILNFCYSVSKQKDYG